MVRIDVGGRKSWGGIAENMPFISLVLQYYRLYALHHTIPPPWGSHISKPPNRKFAPARRKQKERFVRQSSGREGK